MAYDVMGKHAALNFRVSEMEIQKIW